MALYYHTLIGVLRWMVQLGRVDIKTEVSMMSCCLALPHEGHLQALLYMMQYLEKKHNAVLEFNPSEPNVDYDHFVCEDWTSSIYANERGELKEDNLTNLL